MALRRMEIGAPLSKEERSMNFDIGSVPPAAAVAASSRASRAQRTAATEPAAADEAVTVQTIEPSPPPEVHAAMAKAAGAYDKLQASGHQLQFHLDTNTGHVEIEVHDLEGHVLFTVPPSKALQIATDGVIG
jgi:hypothetical protein